MTNDELLSISKRLASAVCELLDYNHPNHEEHVGAYEDFGNMMKGKNNAQTNPHKFVR